MLAGDVYTFLESKDKILLLHSCPNDVFKTVEEVDVVVNHESMDTNGWEWDWWVQAKYKKQKLMISGSGFYGSAKIEKVKSFD